jgi:hypothetical protein
MDYRRRRGSVTPYQYREWRAESPPTDIWTPQRATPSDGGLQRKSPSVTCHGQPSSTTIESAEHLQRKRRQQAYEAEVRKREDEGKKPHFVFVDSEGQPYGLGMTTWNADLNKLMRGLDPSYNDIRKQPYNKMETLHERLDESFEYSARLKKRWLRKKIGDKLKAYRFKVMEMIRSGSECPKWFDGDVWDRMVRFQQSDRCKQKSEQMQMAVSKRKTMGRTRPKGKAGMRAMLREKMGRSPDPEDVREEMDRDKGYGGRQRKKHVAKVVNVKETSNSEGSCEYFHSVPPPLANVENNSIQNNTCVQPVPDGKEDLENGSGLWRAKEGGITEVLDGRTNQNIACMHRLVSLIEKQIQELLLSTQGSSAEVLELVRLLRAQVLELKNGSSNSTPPACPVTLRSASESPAQSPEGVSGGNNNSPEVSMSSTILIKHI